MSPRSIAAAASAKESSFNMERLDIKSGSCATGWHNKPKEKTARPSPICPTHLKYRLKCRRNYSKRFIPSNAAIL
jgi:hypothetical protein